MRRIGLIMGMLLLMSLSACTTTLVPPTNVSEAATVYVLDHGRTPSLVLPRDDGRMARYVYGDWAWYALDKTNLFTALAALLWPSQGAVGRAIMPGPATLEEVQRHTSITHGYPIVVERNLVRSLQAKLDAIFEQERDREVLRPGSDLRFVPHPQKYSYFNNSNGMIAKWVEEMGVEARGITLASKWRVQAPPQPATDQTATEANP